LTLQAQPHRHFIDTDLTDPNNALRQVGPRYCDNPALKSAFTQFHANVHTHNGVTGEIGPDTPAPGLHNKVGADITARPCSFTA